MYNIPLGQEIVPLTVPFLSKLLTFEKSLLFSAHLMQQGYCDNTYSRFNCTGYAIHSEIMTLYTMMTISKLKKTDDTF